MAIFTSHRQSAGRLWLALRLPDLPAHALGLAIDAPEPEVITAKRQLVWMNAAATNAGIQMGMDATTAQLLSGCTLHERDQLKEQLCLAELAEGLYQFSPYIETYSSEQVPQSGLLLEISSCLLLFGGTGALSSGMRNLLGSTRSRWLWGWHIPRRQLGYCHLRVIQSLAMKKKLILSSD